MARGGRNPAPALTVVVDAAADLAGPLKRLASLHVAGVIEVSMPLRLSGSASQESWAFDAIGPEATAPLILRRAPGGDFERDAVAGRSTEAAVVQAAGDAGVPVAPVRHVLDEADGLGRGFVSDRIAGETIPR